MKRVRSKKIENEKKLLVLYEKEIEQEKLQEYAGAILSTGVEKEEEEEHHLKEVILGREENIPTPSAIKSEDHEVKRVKISEDLEHVDSVESTVDNYLLETADVVHPFPDDPVYQIYVKEDDVPISLLPYVCFRKREIKSIRKARKSDGSVEKIKKIKVDLQMIKRLSELCIQRDTHLLNHLSSILSIFNICREMNKRLDIGVLNISESILRDILFTKLISKNDLFFKKIPSFVNLYTCRKSIGSLRKLFKTGPPEEDAIALTQKQIEYLNTF
ncbi:hypothetical protein NEFER03_1291 [Nematocida sp. LUAm3]|nr:hypothetical protein NEFER03_1291 [Nematocida sp. LUAm3]KAI5174087.1 hypothetical protein NEFER02_0554 [Nematocida sp. LUAm2]KAI5177170.1 hypothetical protein NEFER01_0445 [Nematocida sp. LUAm1]